MESASTVTGTVNATATTSAASIGSVVEADALSGYLMKKARNDKWQRRWFETQGFYLVYYKNRKMEKLLAALSLPQVGEIRLIPVEEDPEKLPGLFALELNNRVYTLRANSNEEAELWVRVMLKLREQGQNQTNSDTPNPGAEGGLQGTEIGKQSPQKPPNTPGAVWVKDETKPKSQMLCGCCPCC